MPIMPKVVMPVDLPGLCVFLQPRAGGSVTCECPLCRTVLKITLSKKDRRKGKRRTVVCTGERDKTHEAFQLCVATYSPQNGGRVVLRHSVTVFGMFPCRQN